VAPVLQLFAAVAILQNDRLVGVEALNLVVVVAIIAIVFVFDDDLFLENKGLLT
jgi:hypothetical protein